MEKSNLSKQKLLAIEKIRRSQNIGSGKSAKSKKVRSAKAANSSTHSVSNRTAAEKHEAFFPATEPYFYGTSRPAEARVKSQTLIDLQKKFNNKKAKKLVNPKKNKIRPISLFSVK